MGRVQQNAYFASDRRSLPRHAVSRPVTLRSPLDAFSATTGVTRNVSGSGILLMVEAHVAVGTAVEVLFDMPTIVGDNYYPVMCTGAVVRVESSSAGGFEAAVAFKELRFVAQV
jgi:hypothetical protein